MANLLYIPHDSGDNCHKIIDEQSYNTNVNFLGRTKILKITLLLDLDLELMLLILNCYSKPKFISNSPLKLQ